VLWALGASSSAFAANGTWINATTGGLWSNSANWAGGMIADGQNAIADFSTLDITAEDTVHLDSSRTIGLLKFGDIVPSNNWTLDNNGIAANVLTVGVTSGSPQIMVIDRRATLSLGIAGTNVLTSGAGTLVLSGTADNTSLGLTVTSGITILAKTSSSGVHAIGGGGLVVNGGTAQLGGSGGDQIYDFANVTVGSGTFDTNGQSETFNNLSLAGTGISGAGALLNSTSAASTVTTNGSTSLTANTTIGVAAGGSLTLNSTISGGFGITEIGPGTLTLGGASANSFTGVTNVIGGTLMLAKPTFTTAISGDLHIGNGTGAPGSAVVLDVNSAQLANSASATTNVTIQSDGILNLQNNYETIGNLTMTGGTVTGGAGHYLVFNGTSISTQSSSYTAMISVNNVLIGSVPFTVAQGTTASGIDLDVSSQLVDYGPSFGAFGSVTKAGPGTLRLSGNNSFSDGVALNAGTLIIANNNALGTGTLTAGGGALAADNNGPYVVNNAISLSSTLTVSGGGSFTLAGPISGSGGLTKAGSATLTLSGIESFTGPISINGGTLAMNTSLSGNVTNSAAFAYNSGTFGGRLTNLGTVVLNADFTAGNGMENDGNFALAAGRTVTLNGGGLDNEGTLTMTGGTLNLNASGNNINRGNFNLSSNLGLGGATLTNSGSLNLNGGLISGATGLLVNSADGILSGTGTIQSPFNNSGGVLAVGNGSLNVTAAFSNSGVIQLTSVTSELRGGNISNAGTIQGVGLVGNATTNTGTIEALAGTLVFGGTLLNPAGGLLTAGAGSKLFITGGLAANHGVINLAGGVFDNGGNPLNNTVNGQMSGWGIFRAGGTGLDNHGSITFSGGLTTVNGPVTNENGQTIVVAYNPAIFTGLVTNNGGGTFNIISTTATFAGGSSGTFSGTFTNNANSAFSEGGSGTLEVDGAPTLNNSSSLAVSDSSTLRFKATTGAATIGTGVTARVNNGATLELAGSVSALSSGTNRVNITNNSGAVAGVVISGTNQQVGGIDGPGNVQVNAGASLTANHITAGVLVIGGTAGNPGLATIDASDSSGNPLGESSGFALAGSLQPSAPFASGAPSSSSLDPPSAEGFSGDSMPAGPFVNGAAVGIDPAAVPEPSALLLAVIAATGAAGMIRGPVGLRRAVKGVLAEISLQ
jgi:autotransporter-associated beta strand protein